MIDYILIIVSNLNNTEIVLDWSTANSFTLFSFRSPSHSRERKHGNRGRSKPYTVFLNHLLKYLNQRPFFSPMMKWMQRLSLFYLSSNVIAKKESFWECYRSRSLTLKIRNYWKFCETLHDWVLSNEIYRGMLLLTRLGNDLVPISYLW